ncbi:Hypothetical protein, putative [Bodo saltans]|uniref:Uncharacterized protein n=1 Tax=Bodo saltans TaxID=75058 RepID=A0A0S4IT76_BODSA|nr:Hypothetical protein, putative [Bodo saltans]|eukprot:CUF13137.1 Hypothetical protein, putative [Bodo saltans]
MEIEGERRIAVMVLSDTKLKDPTPKTTLFPLMHAAIVEVDSTSTKFGIQRAVPLCLEWLDEQFHHLSNDDDPSQRVPLSVCLLCVDGERDGHIVAAIATAMQAHLHHVLSCGASTRHTKASLRIHQAAVADALGPRCIYRSDMIQLNRHFLSGEQ